MIATMESMRTMQLTMQSTQSGMADQMQAMRDNQTAMGKAFDQARTTTPSTCRRRFPRQPRLQNAA